MVIFNTPLKISMCNVSQNRMTSNSKKNAPSALRHNVRRDGTIGTTNTWDLPCAHVYVRARALIEQWPKRRKKKNAKKTFIQKGNAMQKLSNGMAMKACAIKYGVSLGTVLN